MQKHLFLLTKMQTESSYDFVPYKFGCYSFGAAADKNPLIKGGHLVSSDNWTLEKGKRYSHLLKRQDLDCLLEYVKKYGHLSGDNLIREVYSQYPYFTINSEIADDILGTKKAKSFQSEYKRSKEPALFTIGYEGRTIESYINILIQNGVNVLCDVRKNPISRKFGFSKKSLSSLVSKMGIEYIHIGELGIESSARKSLNDQKDYEDLFANYRKTTLKENAEAVSSIAELVSEKKGRIALTCFEADHKSCHRNSIATEIKKLPFWEIEVSHI